MVTRNGLTVGGLEGLREVADGHHWFIWDDLRAAIKAVLGERAAYAEATRTAARLKKELDSVSARLVEEMELHRQKAKELQQLTARWGQNPDWARVAEAQSADIDRLKNELARERAANERLTRERDEAAQQTSRFAAQAEQLAQFANRVNAKLAHVHNAFVRLRDDLAGEPEGDGGAEAEAA
jgi:uncharacterized coiled-coil DUF342 family protein